eukprot:1180176-Prorocentrum_minimum.AAC.3
MPPLPPSQGSQAPFLSPTQTRPSQAPPELPFRTLFLHRVKCVRNSTRKQSWKVYLVEHVEYVMLRFVTPLCSRHCFLERTRATDRTWKFSACSTQQPFHGCERSPARPWPHPNRLGIPPDLPLRSLFLHRINCVRNNSARALVLAKRAVELSLAALLPQLDDLCAAEDPGVHGTPAHRSRAEAAVLHMALLTLALRSWRRAGAPDADTSPKGCQVSRGLRGLFSFCLPPRKTRVRVSTREGGECDAELSTGTDDVAARWCRSRMVAARGTAAWRSAARLRVAGRAVRLRCAAFAPPPLLSTRDALIDYDPPPPKTSQRLPLFERQVAAARAALQSGGLLPRLLALLERLSERAQAAALEAALRGSPGAAAGSSGGGGAQEGGDAQGAPAGYGALLSAKAAVAAGAYAPFFSEAQESRLSAIGILCASNMQCAVEANMLLLYLYKTGALAANECSLY